MNINTPDPAYQPHGPEAEGLYLLYATEDNVEVWGYCVSRSSTDAQVGDETLAHMQLIIDDLADSIVACEPIPEKDQQDYIDMVISIAAKMFKDALNRNIYQKEIT